MSAELRSHLESGATTVARCFAVTRRDGPVLGFTDHDLDIEFEGIRFRADTGLTAKAVQQATGLSVDNTEAYGGLSSEAINEADILAGRFDGAEVAAWLVNWADPSERIVQFRGTLGEVTRAGGAFSAELRGLTEALNQAQGQVYHARCSAVLGDARCQFDLDGAGYSVSLPAETVGDATAFRFASMPGFDDRWFERGRLRVLSGQAAGLIGVIKNDRIGSAGERVIELWTALGAECGYGRHDPAGGRLRPAGRDLSAEVRQFSEFSWLSAHSGRGLVDVLSRCVGNEQRQQPGYPVGERGRMSMRGDRVVAIARDWIGTPYVHQASAQGAGCDCLGLLRGVWRALIRR